MVPGAFNTVSPCDSAKPERGRICASQPAGKAIAFRAARRGLSEPLSLEGGTLMLAGRFESRELLPYWIAQVVGSILAAATLFVIATGAAGFDPLYDAAGRDGSLNEPAVDFALLRFVALPQVFDQLAARGEAGLAPMLLLNAPHPTVRAEARARVAEMVEAGVPVTELPDPALLRELAGAFPGEGYNRLLARCAHGGPAAAVGA